MGCKSISRITIGVNGKRVSDMSETYGEMKERLDVEHCGEMMMEGVPSSFEGYLLYKIANLTAELEAD